MASSTEFSMLATMVHTKLTDISRVENMWSVKVKLRHSRID